MGSEMCIRDRVCYVAERSNTVRSTSVKDVTSNAFSAVQVSRITIRACRFIERRASKTVSTLSRTRGTCSTIDNIAIANVINTIGDRGNSRAHVSEGSSNTISDITKCADTERLAVGCAISNGRLSDTSVAIQVEFVNTNSAGSVIGFAVFGTVIN